MTTTPPATPQTAPHTRLASTTGLIIRSTIFNILATFYTLIPTLLFVWIIFLPPRIIFKFFAGWQKGLVWLERHILKLTYRLVGWENVPQGACIIAAKHQSAFETYLLHILFFNPAILLKKEITQVPIWGLYAKASGMIPVDRKAGVKALILMKKIAQNAKKEGKKIVIFPEGTRVPPGQCRSYKSGVAILYEELGIPVIPVALNSGLFWPKKSYLKKSGTVTIEFLPAIEPGLPRAEFMQRLTNTIETASNKLLEKP